MTATYVVMFCRIALAMTFAWSASSKLRDMSAFRDGITAFRLLPAQWSAVLAWSFLGGEVAVTLLMAIGWPGLLRLGFVLAVGLLLIFSVALGSVMRRALRVSCNCFGRAEHQVSWYDLARNSLLIGCGLAGGWSLAAAQRQLTVSDTALLAIMALCFVVLITHLSDIVETLRQPFEVQ